MPTIQELRQQYPGYAEMRDEDIIADMAEANSVSAGTMARFLGWTPPSFKQEAVSGLKRGLGSMVAGGGQLMADAGWEDNPVLSYGKDVQSANPSRINSLEDVAAYPAAALGNATGTAVSFLGPQLGLRAVGKGLEAYGAARAAGLVGGMPGQTVMAGIPSYSDIRDSQIEAGQNNVPLALLGAGAVGAIENLGGVQRLMGIGRAAPKVLSKADEVASFGATPIRTGAKTLGRSMLEEGGEEIIQTPIEQLSGYKDPTTSQSLHETALGGVLGAMGGAIGLPVAVSSGLRHSQINQYRQSDLLSPDVPLNTLDDQAQWNREFMARDIGRDAADSWYASRMEGVVQDRDALIAERDRIARDAQFNELAAQRMGFNTYADYQAWEAEQEARTGTRRPTINERLGMLERQLPPGLVGMTTPITFTPSATENQPIVGALGNRRPNVAKPAQVAKKAVEAPKQEVGQKSAAASTTQGVETAAVVSQARPEFALEMQDSRFVGPEPVEVQEAVAATTPRGQKSLFDKNGKPTKTAIVAAPAKSQGAGTLAALQQKVDELFTPETEQHAAHTNAITTAKTYLQARLALAKLSPEGLRIALRTAPEKERAIINAVLGMDAEGNQVAQPRSYQDVGVQFGYPEKTARSNVQNLLKKYGIDREAVDKTVGSGEVGVTEKEKEEELDAPVTVKRPDENGVLQTVEVVPAKQKRKRIATAKGETTGGNQTANQLMQSQAVDSEGGTLEDAGFSVLDRASDSKVVEDARTAADTAKADRAIKEGVKEEKPELAARLEREAEEVAARSKSAESITKANREAAAAARTQSVEDEESAKSLNWVDHRGLPIQKADADEAALEYDAVARRLGKPEFGSLTEAEQLQVTRAYVSYMDDAIKAKDLKRVLNNVAEQTKQPSVERKAEKENDLSAVSGRGGEQSGEPSETLPNPASESAVEPAGEASEVTPVQIAQAWHDYAQRWNLPKLHDLAADQQEELLSAYDQDSLQSAIRAIHDELNESSPQFSESTPKLGTNATEIAGNLKKLFFSPSRFDSLVTIVQSVNDLPETARQQLSQAADPSKVSGFVANGKVFLIADNIQAGKELSVFLHELGAHIGLKKLIGEANLKRLIAQIEAWAKKNDGSVESKLAKRAEERAAQSSSEDVQEEKLAYFIEEAVKAGINPTAVTRSQSGVLQNFFRTLIAALKTALRKIGLGRFDKLTAQNIVDLAYGAADLELNGTWHGTAADFRKFDHSYMGSGEGAQAYGWGTYLAQRVGIAKGYWENDVGRKGGGSVFATELRERLAGGVFDGGSNADIQENYAGGRMTEQELREQLKVEEKKEGSLMRVRPLVSEDELLDWDKPLSEQSEKVKKVLADAKFMPEDVNAAIADRARKLIRAAKELPAYATLAEHAPQTLKAVDALEDAIYDKKPYYEVLNLATALKNDAFGSQIPNIDTIVNGLNKLYDSMGSQTGSSAYEYLTAEYGSDKAASEYLDSIGINGIKFLDEKSRNNPSGVLGWSQQQAERELARNEALLAEMEAAQQEHHDVDYQKEVDAQRVRVKRLREMVSEYAKPQTRNLVIFNDKNIARVATQVGARRDAVKFSEATVYPTQDKIAELTDKLPVALRDKAYEIATNMVDIAKRSVYATAFGHDFARMVQGILPQAKTFFDLKGRQSAALIKREAKVDEIMELAHKDKKSIPALNSFLEDSTRNQLWGFQPDWKQEPVAIDPEMERRFKQLSPSAQKAAVEVFRYGFQNVSELNKLVKEELNDYDTEGLTAEEKKDIEKKKLRALTLFDKTFKAMQGPYAPLVRVGDYVAVAKSQEFIDAQNRGDDKAVERMQADPDHYIVDYYESLGAAKNAARKLAATGKYAKGESAPDGYAKEHYYNKANETPWGALKKVRQMVDSEGDEARTKEEKAAARAMSNMLHDLYFQSLAEGSVRQFQSKRRNVASQKMDMLRGFAIKGRADAHFLSHLMFASQVGKAITDMRANAKGADARRALNEVLKRQAASLEYRQRPVLSFIQGVTSFWMLVTSPAYYVQNSTQPFMMTLPWLAGKYGYAKSWGAFFGAYNALIKGGLDIDKMPVSQAEKAMLHQLRDEGILDIGINRDLGYWANTDSAGLNHLASFQHMFTKKVQQLETVNRISSALAAYRLSNGSVEVAAEAIRTTHGDYAQFNEPGFFSRVPAGRLILQFRKFQIIQLSMMTRLLADSMRGQNKAVAAKSLGFLLGHIGVMAGALGLPFMSLIAPVLAAAVGDGDDPDDLEYLLRKAIDDEAAANLILRGAPAGMGVNLSNRLGMQNMTSVFPFAEKDPLSKEGFQERALALLGPWAGLGANAADGIHLMMRGDYWKGAEKLIPKGPADALKAMRFAVDGVTQRSNNDMLLRPEEISLLDASFQALGLPTTKLSERQRRQGELIKVEDHFKQLATDIKYKYTKAVKEGDSGEIAELQKEWASLQEAKVRNGFKRDGLSTLLKAPQEQAKRERNAIEGVEYKKNSRGFVQATADQ